MKGIDAPDGAFDSVFCIRTLFALEGAGGIVREMARITRPGGRILFDYGTSPRDASVGEGIVATSTTDIRTVAADVGLRVERAYRLDSPFIMAIRKTGFLRRAFNSHYNVLPNWLYEGIERIGTVVRAERLLYVFRKPERGDVATEWRGEPA
jgi:SAM-dependent methyltransferase